MAGTCIYIQMLDSVQLIAFPGGIIIRPFISQWSDRYGRRWPFMISLWLATISNLACSFAPNYMIFLCFRFLAGAGTAVSIAHCTHY